MAKKNKNIVNKFLQGWQQLFGANQEQSLKPFPENHFYSPEELDYLSKSNNLSVVDQWAVTTGRWAYDQSRDKLSETPFTSVKWQDGLMATFVDGRLVPDTANRQAEKLILLKEQGFDIPRKYENIITNYEANRLIGKYFSTPESGCIIKVVSYQEPQLATDHPKLILQKWDNDLSMTMGEINYATLKGCIGKDYIGFTEEAEKHFEHLLQERKAGKEQFNHAMSAIKNVYPPLVGNTIDPEQRKIYAIDDYDGAFLPISWSLDGNRINVTGQSNDKNQLTVIKIDANNAYKYKNLLTPIEIAVQKERLNGTTRSLVEILGNNFGEGKIFAKTNNEPLVMTKTGIVNAVVSTKDGQIFAFNLDKHQEISLDMQEKKDLMTTLMLEGRKEQTALVDKISVPKMKDYVESLRNPEDIFSGETDSLPIRSTVNKLYCEYEKLSEEYSSYANSTLPLSTEDRNELFADLETSYLAYKQELSKMVAAYTSQPDFVEVKDVQKLERLDDILEHKDSNQPRHHKMVDSVPLTQEEKELRDSLVEKLRSNGMEVVTDWDDVIRVHEEASSPVREMGSRTNKKMAKIGQELVGRELTKEQNAVVQQNNNNIDRTDEKSRDFKTAIGRWHQPKIVENAVYHQYGKLLSERLSMQLTYEELPWIKKQSGQPRDLKQNEYGGITSLMLALDTEKNGYVLPIYIDKEEVSKRGLTIKASAEGFPVITESGIKEVYNIEQTNYPSIRARSFEDLKLQNIAANRYQGNSNDLNLLKKKGWPASILFDGKEDLASYSYKTNSIHIAPEASYQDKDKLYRDLSEGLVRSTRSDEAKNTKYESMIKEELISLVGSVMLGQKLHFEVTTPQQSSMWKDRLKSDPAFTKQVLGAADKSVSIIHKRINDIKRSVDQDLDIRSTTPIDYDVDGNGIIESQEKLAPDKKQGANESSEAQSDDVPQQEHRHHKWR